MSLEAAIAELTKAIHVQTEAVNKSNDLAERMIGLKSEAIETVKQTAAKPDAAPVKAKVESKTETPKVETKAEEKPKEVELDPIAKAISEYVGGGYDASHEKAADERRARSSKVKEIFAVIAQKSGAIVQRHTDIPESFHGAFLKTLAKRVEEGNLVIGKADDDDLMGS